MKKIFLLLACLSAIYAYSQYAEEDVLNYIDQYSKLAVQSMKTYKIPASVKLAQAIYSSNAGQSKVAKEANNHFGLLCNTEYQGEQYYETSDRSGNCYRTYNTVEESFQDHNQFLTTRPRYESLFQLSPTDYRAWATGLQACGYSINPEYAQRLINIIERYTLTRFDKQGMPAPDVETAVAEPQPMPKAQPAQTMQQAQPQAQPTAQSETQNQPQPKPVAESPKPAPKAQETVQTNPAPQPKRTYENGMEPDTIINGIEIYVQRGKKSSADAGKPIINMNVFTAKPNEYRVSYFPYTKRDVYENNKIKFVIAKKGDTYAKIAKEAQLLESDLRFYNDVDDDYEPLDGEVVYLQMKNTKSEVSYHKLEMADSFRYLSQKYAVQLKTLVKRNKTPEGGFTVGSLICIDCK
ncbi:MAG: glucosaminidase domain-containing protein [Bacteroidales bacterium]|nr:glucosaminidase domain-containing protein [Bacteroidales bacterium]